MTSVCPIISKFKVCGSKAKSIFFIYIQKHSPKCFIFCITTLRFALYKQKCQKFAVSSPQQGLGTMFWFFWNILLRIFFKGREKNYFERRKSIFKWSFEPQLCSFKISQVACLYKSQDCWIIKMFELTNFHSFQKFVVVIKSQSHNQTDEFSCPLNLSWTMFKNYQTHFSQFANILRWCYFLDTCLWSFKLNWYFANLASNDKSAT